MADLTLCAGRPYSLVTTVVHRGRGALKFAQLDLNLTSASVRLRFLDPQCLHHFHHALNDLARQAALPDRLNRGPVLSRIYTDQDERAHNAVRELLLDEELANLAD